MPTYTMSTPTSCFNCGNNPTGTTWFVQKSCTPEPMQSDTLKETVREFLKAYKAGEPISAYIEKLESLI